METKKINIAGSEYEFTKQIFIKHLKKMELITEKQQKKEIWNIDFMIEVAKILLVNGDTAKLEDTLNNLDFKGFEAFSNDFKEIIEAFSQLTADKKK